MARKPQNHVTRGQDAFLSGEDIKFSLPLLERHHIERLEALFPPRCLGRSENAEEHLRYAGMVELVQNLRIRFDDKHADAGDEGVDPETDGENAQHA